MTPVIDTRNRINQITSKPDRRHDCKSKGLRATEPADLACNEKMKMKKNKCHI